MASFNDSAGHFAKLLLTGKHKGSLDQKGTSRESIYVKFMGATCLSDELGRLKKKKRKTRGCQASLADSRIECLRDRSAILNLLTVRVVALEYSQVHKKA